MYPASRRHFLKQSTGLGLSLALAPFARVRGANDAIRVGVIGLRTKGAQHINRFRSLAGVRVVALCDVDRDVLAREVKAFAGRNESVRAYRDVRHLLESDDLDAVVVATPNHWHALMGVWACQAGKDVYLEKPVSHNIWEGRQIVAAARKYKRIVQTGSQLRSDRGLQEAVAYVRQGHLGRILWARGVFYRRRPSIGKVAGAQRVPESIDYDLWTGPAPLTPLRRARLHEDWHWVWPTGNGDTGNFGTHYIDVCRWFLGEKQLAPRTISVGERFGYDDDGETPNTHISLLDYKTAPLIFEVRGLPHKRDDSAMDAYRDVRLGVVVQCEHGYFAGGWAYDRQGKRIKQFKRVGSGDHQANFIEAVRSRRREDLQADIAEGHVSAALCHAANISHRIGKPADPAQIRERIASQPDFAETFERLEKHLSANGIDLKRTQAVLGPWLAMDPQRERFVGANAEQANRLLTRNYRKPYVVPDQV